MATRKSVATFLLVIAAGVLLSLVLDASCLKTILPGGLPLGIALTPIGLCAAAGSAIELSTRHTALRAVAVVSLVGAVAWLPVSVALAANPTLNLHGGHGFAWLVFSLCIVAVVLCAVTWAPAMTVLRKHRRAGAA